MQDFKKCEFSFLNKFAWFVEKFLNLIWRYSNDHCVGNVGREGEHVQLVVQKGPLRLTSLHIGELAAADGITDRNFCLFYYTVGLTKR